MVYKLKYNVLIMNKSNFALSWGRKIFFSAGLILTFICGATFFTSKVFPADMLGWIYFVVTFIGWYGILLTVGYFIFYRFFAKVFPSYYILRFSSLLILIVLNGMILFDSYLFAHYQVHLSSMVMNLIQDDYFFKSIGVTGLIWVSLAGGFFIFSLLFWIHGENIWRAMQTRFSNPTSNWYIVFFVICFVSSHLIYIFGSVNKLSNYFFLPQVLQVSDILKNQVEGVVNMPQLKGGNVNNLFYPKRNLNCSKNPEFSVILVKIDELNSADIDPEVMPHLLHMKEHGMSLDNHHGTAYNLAEADFSMTYSIPAFYQSDLEGKTKSPIELVLEKSSFSLVKLKNPDEMTFENQIQNEKFFLEVNLSYASKNETDKKLYNLIEAVNNIGRVSDTIIIITGKIGIPQIPAIVLWPERNLQNVSKFTSHYDFVPTLLEENFSCKNLVTDYSFGSNIFSEKKTEMLYVSRGKNLEILDIESQSLMKTDFQTINPFPRGKELPKFMMAVEQFHYFNTPSL